MPTTGKLTYPNGDTYEGEFHKCMPHGKGILREKNGTFEGQFEHGDFTDGTIHYSDGAVYHGQMDHGVKKGANSEFIFDDG